MRLFVELSREKAGDLGVALDEGLIAYIGGFMDEEIGRYREESA